MDNPKKNSYLKYSGLGIQIITTVGIGVIAGMWFDKKVVPNKNSIFTIIFSLLMIIVAMIEVFRTFKDKL